MLACMIGVAMKAQTKVPDMSRFVPNGKFAPETHKSTFAKSAKVNRAASGERDMSLFTNAPIQKGGGSARRSAARTATTTTQRSELLSNRSVEKREAPKVATTAPAAATQQFEAEAPAKKQ